MRRRSSTSSSVSASADVTCRGKAGPRVGQRLSPSTSARWRTGRAASAASAARRSARSRRRLPGRRRDRAGRATRRRVRCGWDRIAGMSLPTSTTGPGGSVCERQLHAPAEIALPLWPHAARAARRCQAGWRVSVSGVTNSQTVQRGSRDMRRDLSRRGSCDRSASLRPRRSPGETSLDAAELRRAGEDHEMTRHRPYRRREGVAAGTPARIEREAGQVAQRAHHPAVALVARRRGDAPRHRAAPGCFGRCDGRGRHLPSAAAA